MSLLLNNAVTSIRMGIEDYSSDKPDRSLSAVRNFYAGVLLLAKEVLVRAAPRADRDEVISARYKPVPDGSGGVTHAPDGYKTVDFDTIGKRFKDFNLEIDQAALAELNKIRNEIEHLYTERPAVVVREAIARAFPVTLELFRLAGEDPRMLLGEAWQIMLRARDLYQTELARCRSTLDSIQWRSDIVGAEHLRCVNCDSDLIEQRNPTNADQDQMALVCQACGAEPTAADAIVAAVDNALNAEAYIRAKESGESGPIYDCPECLNASYIDTEARCAVCGHEFRWEPCARCYASIPLEDALAGMSEGLCSYCTHLAEKDD